MKVISFLVLALAALCCCTREKDTLISVDFDDSLGKGHKAFREMVANPADRQRYEQLKKIWVERGPATSPAAPLATLFASTDGQKNPSLNKIPRIIHQIWLGPNPLPAFFQEYQRQLKKLHPDWEYRLWTDKEVEQELGEQGGEQRPCSLWHEIKACKNYGQQSDLVRVELLLRFGGVYVDVDVLAIKPFDPILKRYDFFAGLEAPHCIGDRSDHYLFITNAIIGAAPAHPILEMYKGMIQKRYAAIERMDIDMVQRVLLSTFFPFGEAVDMGIAANNDSIIFPPTYFYPIKPPNKSEPKKTEPGMVKRILRSLHIKKAPIFSTVQRETIAVHDFASTWQEHQNEM